MSAETIIYRANFLLFSFLIVLSSKGLLEKNIVRFIPGALGVR